jgi:hypothetical protein
MKYSPEYSPESTVSFVALTSSALLLSGCRVVGDIFKAGVSVGAVTVMGVAVVASALIGFAKRSQGVRPQPDALLRVASLATTAASSSGSTGFDRWVW